MSLSVDYLEEELHRQKEITKIPIMRAGKIDEAASPKARATTWAANPGGFNPIAL